jgi:hypothetical protein
MPQTIFDLEFAKFSSIGRLYRDVTITEKIDGMNACIVIVELNGEDLYLNAVAHVKAMPFNSFEPRSFAVGVQSRKQFLSLDNDIQGLAAWVLEHAQELVQALGPGYHYGEYWGKNIQRSYHQKRNWFSLFNTKRWSKDNVGHIDGLLTVPVLYSGPYADWVNEIQLHRLETQGSFAAQEVDDRELDFRAEGIVGWHVALDTYYKVTLEGDGHKGAAKKAAEARKEKLAGYPKFMKLIGATNDPAAK